MDIGFETIIYIVLGLVFVFAQFAKKKKKAAQYQSTEGESDTSDDTSSQPSLFEQLLGVPEQNSVVEQPGDTHQFPPEDQDPVFLQPEPKASTDAISDKPIDVIKPLQTGASVNTQKKKSSNSSGFNLRTAVIYKAVLDRKNF